MIATETSEEIEARRARDRRNHMDLKTAEVPLFQQTRVRFKMRQFHSRLKSVCVPRCVTKGSMHLSISHSLCSAVHSYDSLCRRSSRSPMKVPSTHRDFRVRRSVVHRALNWLVTHNQYYRSNHVHIDVNALEQLPHDGNLSQLTAITSRFANGKVT